MIESEPRDAEAHDNTRDPEHAISGGGTGAREPDTTTRGYAENDVPQPQVDLAFGLLKLNPVPLRPSEKSSVVSLRNT